MPIYFGIIKQFAETGKPFWRNHKCLSIGQLKFRILVNQVFSKFEKRDTKFTNLHLHFYFKPIIVLTAINDQRRFSYKDITVVKARFNRKSVLAKLLSV